MELYKILKTRKGEKKSFKRVDYKQKKREGKKKRQLAKETREVLSPVKACPVCFII